MCVGVGVGWVGWVCLCVFSVGNQNRSVGLMVSSI